MTDLTTIVTTSNRLGYVAVVVRGTPDAYWTGSTNIRLWRPTAGWAKHAGDARIRHRRRREARRRHREERAHRATGYGQSPD